MSDEKELATAPPAYSPQESIPSPPGYEDPSFYAPSSGASAQPPASFYGPPSASQAYAPPPGHYQQPQYAPPGPGGYPQGPGYTAAPPGAYSPPPAGYQPAAAVFQPAPAPYLEPSPVMTQPIQPLEVATGPKQPAAGTTTVVMTTTTTTGPSAVATSSAIPSKAKSTTGTEGLMIPTAFNMVTVLAMAIGIFALISSVSDACSAQSSYINAMFFPALVLAAYALFGIIYLIFGGIAACASSSSKCWYEDGPKNVWYVFTSIFVVLAIISGGVGIGLLFKIDSCYESADSGGFFAGQIVLFGLAILAGICALVGMLVAWNSKSGEYWYANIFLFQWICLVAGLLLLVCVLAIGGSSGGRSRRRR